MLKRKLIIIALLLAFFVTALAFHSTTIFQTPALPGYAVPADPLPLPIAPPPV